MNEKKLIDDCFYIQQKKYGLWYSTDLEENGLVTSLTEEQCVRATRFFLKVRQEESNGKIFDVKTYSTKDNYKL
jgi:hypothetical protein